MTVWNFHQDFDALARTRGRISEVSETTASFVVTEESRDPSWPGHKDPIGEGNPVYLAEPDSFQPDIVRGAASPEEFEMLREFARQHEEQTGIKPAAAAFGFVPQSPRGTPTATTISTGSTDPREIPLPRRFSPNLAKPHPQHHPRVLPDPSQAGARGQFPDRPPNIQTTPPASRSTPSTNSVHPFNHTGQSTPDFATHYYARGQIPSPPP